MKINWKKIILWFVLLIVWLGLITLANYIIGQSFAQVATDQFDAYTDSYRVLRTQNIIETIITTIGVAGIVFCIVKIVMGFKIKKEVK